jgi:hypothetical protein
MGYLDHYGEGEERREKRIKRIVISALILLIAGSVLYYVFKNYREERQVKRFYALLAAHDYTAAYRMWGCTETSPCRDYSFDRFMRDWGPESNNANPSAVKIVKSRSCGSGVIITARIGEHEEKLWVQRGDTIVGFSPWPACPASGR